MNCLSLRPPASTMSLFHLRNGKQRERKSSFSCVFVRDSSKRPKIETCIIINKDAGFGSIAHNRAKLQLDSTPAASTIFYGTFCEVLEFWDQFGGAFALESEAFPPSKNPLEIKRGNVTVKIYPTVRCVARADYQQPTLVYCQGAGRVRRRFSDRAEAMREAEMVATKLANGEKEVRP